MVDIFKPILFLVTIAMVSCSPDLSVNLAEQGQVPASVTEMRKLSGREGDNNKPGIAYPYTVYTAYDSIYSEDTKTFINGTEVESFKAASVRLVL